MTPKERLNRFLEHLDRVFARDPEFFPFDSRIPGAPMVLCMVYRDVPEPGYITGVTYGLSEVEHEEWKLARPELIISVQSTDVAWPLAVAEMANQLRGKCPFCYGDLINFGEAVSPESEMSAFFVFAPAILERGDFLDIDVGGPRPVSIAGMYPIHDSERSLFGEIGLEAFWHYAGFDMYDVRRKPMVRRT